MGFTFDLSTDNGALRLEIGDTVAGAGVKPDGSNFDDAELQYLIDREGSVMRAAAAACEILARSWARVANISVGSRREDFGAVAEQWAKQAKTLREQYGSASGSVTAFSVGVKRNDGYAAAGATLDGTEYTTS